MIFILPFPCDISNKYPLLHNWLLLAIVKFRKVHECKAFVSQTQLPSGKFQKHEINSRRKLVPNSEESFVCHLETFLCRESRQEHDFLARSPDRAIGQRSILQNPQFLTIATNSKTKK